MHKWIVTYSKKSLKFFYQFSLRVIIAKTYNPKFFAQFDFLLPPMFSLVLSLFLAQNITKKTCKKKLEKKNYYKSERFSLIAIISRNKI